MRNNILLADATRLPIASGVASLIIADPPYAVMKHKDLTRPGAKAIQRYVSWDDMTITQWRELMLLSMREMYRVAGDNATAYIFCATEFALELKELAEYTGWHWRMACIFKKLNPAPRVRVTCFQSSYEPFGMMTKGKPCFNAENGGKIHNVLEFDEEIDPLWIESAIPHHAIRRHETQKPISLLERLVTISSQKGDMVIDPFCGSGSTSIAAKRLGRRSFSCDLSVDYLKSAQRALDGETLAMGI